MTRRTALSRVAKQERTQLQVRPEGKQTAVAILHNKLARMPGCVCKSAREFHASSSILGVKRVYILDEYVRVEQFVRIFVGVGCRRFGKAEVNRALVARNDGVNRRVMPRAQALETKLISVIGKSAGNVHGEELRRDLANHWPSLLQESARADRGSPAVFFLTVARTAFGGQAIADFAKTETADSLRKGCCDAKGLVF